jgi:SAM-dependent methyltransferase
MSTKTIQGKLWSIEPKYWAEHFEPWFSPMYKIVLNQLNLTENHLVLDAGCGSGLFSHLVIRTGASLVGIDAAPGLLDIARIRNISHNFLEEDLEALPFKNDHFDVVAGFNSFQYAGSFENAIAEATRVLKPGGRLVIGIWDKPEKSDATTVLKSIGALLPAPAPGTPGPFALSEDGRIEKSLEKNNLSLAYKTRVNCPFLYSSLADAVKSFMGTGPAAAAIYHNNRQKVEDKITKALWPYWLIDDLYFLQNSFLVFIAEK